MENDCNSYKIRVGNTTFVVCIKQPESAKKSEKTVIKEIYKHEMLEHLLTNSQ